MHTVGAQTIILAAGLGSRMKSPKPKALHLVAGRPMLDHLLITIHKAHLPQPIVVVGHEAEQIMHRFKGRAKFAIQAELTGTLKAVEAALKSNFIQQRFVVVVQCDNPLLKSETLIGAIDKIVNTNVEMVLGVVEVPNFDGEYAPFNSFGRVLCTANGEPCRIVEYKNATQEQREVRTLNAGLYIFRRQWLIDALPKVVRNSVTGEYYLTDLVNIAYNVTADFVGRVNMSPLEAFGVNSQEDLKQLEKMLKEKA